MANYNDYQHHLSLKERERCRRSKWITKETRDIEFPCKVCHSSGRSFFGLLPCKHCHGLGKYVLKRWGGQVLKKIQSKLRYINH